MWIRRRQFILKAVHKLCRNDAQGVSRAIRQNWVKFISTQERKCPHGLFAVGAVSLKCHARRTSELSELYLAVLWVCLLALRAPADWHELTLVGGVSQAGNAPESPLTNQLSQAYVFRQAGGSQDEVNPSNHPRIRRCDHAVGTRSPLVSQNRQGHL